MLADKETYSRDNLDALVDDLVDAQVPIETAESFRQTVSLAMDFASAIEKEANAIYESFTGIIADAVPLALNIELTSGIVSGAGAPVGIGEKVNVIATSFDHRITGSDASNSIDGGGGNDIVYGGDGADNLEGGSGSDSLFGGDGDDRLFGGDGRGADHFDGGGSWDSLEYPDSDAGVTVSLERVVVIAIRDSLEV